MIDKRMYYFNIITSCIIISVISFWLGSKLGGTTKIIYKDIPVNQIDTVYITQERITNATTSKDTPPIISDSLSLDDIDSLMFVKYIAEPFYIRDSLLYQTLWKHNIRSIKELYIDTLNIVKEKKDLKFGCLASSIGYIIGVMSIVGPIVFYLLTK